MQVNSDTDDALHPMVRTMADSFPGPQAGDLTELHQLQKAKRPSSGARDI
jgi:hypothetical protein